VGAYDVGKLDFRKTVNKEFQPNPGPQTAFWLCDARIIGYGGAMGGGKSVWLCAEAVWLSMNYPGNRGYLCRHHLVDVKRSTMVTLEKIAPKGAIMRHVIDDRVIEFWNGSQILYGGLGSQEDVERIKSTEFGWFAIDEATETFEEMFTMLTSRLRWTLPDGTRPPYFGLLASNPEPGWVKKRFVDGHHPNHRFIPALPRDNPYLPGDYDSGLRKMFPEEAAKRYLDGSWDIFEGQIYKEFDRQVHVYDHELFTKQDAKYFDKFRVIDHGYRNPTCCLWVAIDFDGKMWIYDEHYKESLTIEENAAIIRTMSDNEDITTICDPSMFSQTMQKGGRIWSPADEYRDNGITCIKPFGSDGKLPEVTGINLVKQRLKNNMLFIHERCIHTIEEIIGYKWKKLRLSDLNSNNPEQPVDKENHAMDAIRYAVMWRPMNSERPAMPIATDTLHYAILKHKKELGGPFYAGWN